MGLELLKTKLLNKKTGNSFEIKTPIIGASGTFGYADEFENFVDLDYLGAISTKGITVEKRPGNSGQRIYEVKEGMINRIGLENIGIEQFIKTKLPLLKEKNINFILNIAGSKVEDYEKLAKISEQNNIKALEVNVSCPNVQSGCIEFGLNPTSLFQLINKIRNIYQGFLIVKLSPNTQDIKLLASAAQASGADCISAINTLRGLGANINYLNGKFNKTFVQGGLSGVCIKPVALYMIKQIKEAVEIPIIAMGGISCLQDLFEFMSVGADAFQIGTTNFINPAICSDLAFELEKFIKENNFKNFDELKGKIYND